MPLYDYRCPKGHQFEAFRHIEKRHEGPWCGDCDVDAHLVPSTFNFKMPTTRVDRADGEGFSSRDVSTNEIKELRQGYALSQT